MIAFGHALPRIRRRVRRDIRRQGLQREKILAAVVRLLELTALRVGKPVGSKARAKRNILRAIEQVAQQVLYTRN
jgi:DNA topoisomerase IB